ncbi:MAG TPA: hypothetical protein VGL13_12395 [Polyangiaceae bacterium]
MPAHARVAFFILEFSRSSLIEQLRKSRRSNLVFVRVEEAPEKALQPSDDPPRSITRRSSRDDPNRHHFEPLVVRAPSLHESLRWHLRMSGRSETECRFAERLISRSNGEGHLDLTQRHIDGSIRMHEEVLEEIAQETGLNPRHAVPALEAIQRMCPTGSLARDALHAMSIQGRRLGLQDGDPELDIIKHHGASLHDVDESDLASELGVSFSRAAQAIDFVRYLQIAPARRLTGPGLVVPDVKLVGHAGDFAIVPEPRGIPRLTIDESVATALMLSPVTREHGVEASRRAKELIHAVDQRIKTIVRITECLVEKQLDYFVRGASLVRLALADVAEAVCMHESTIARVAIDKYVSTPRGLLELKTLLGAG